MYRFLKKVHDTVYHFRIYSVFIFFLLVILLMDCTFWYRFGSGEFEPDRWFQEHPSIYYELNDAETNVPNTGHNYSR